MSVHHLIIDDIVKRGLLEDLGHGHDITSLATVPAGTTGSAVMLARESGVISGVDVVVSVFRQTDSAILIKPLKHDGQHIEENDKIIEFEGDARGILTAERTALNLICHMSGIATETARYVAAVAGTGAQIVCTRKTLPGLRPLQKYAVKCGGGANHRFGLDDAILIKDNHIAYAGGIDKAIENAKKHAGHMVKIEVEVDTLDQLETALGYDIDVVLLDNMRGGTLRSAVDMAKDKDVLTEASGGIDFTTIRAVAESGVDMISVGALTHSVKVFDIGLDIE